MCDGATGARGATGATGARGATGTATDDLEVRSLQVVGATVLSNGFASYTLGTGGQQLPGSGGGGGGGAYLLTTTLPGRPTAGSQYALNGAAALWSNFSCTARLNASLSTPVNLIVGLYLASSPLATTGAGLDTSLPVLMSTEVEFLLPFAATAPHWQVASQTHALASSTVVALPQPRLLSAWALALSGNLDGVDLSLAVTFRSASMPS